MICEEVRHQVVAYRRRRALRRKVAAATSIVARLIAEEVSSSRTYVRRIGEFQKLGFPGCIGSMDATHLHWKRCPAGAINTHKGKEGFPTRAFNVTVSHSGKAYSIAPGQAGARNDKCIVRFDPFMQRMRFEKLYADITYILHDKDGVGKEHVGAYVISDNGYHHWKEFTCPFKVHADAKMIRWSKWVESVRKNVECFFGRLKMRFRCLLNPIWISNEAQIDDMFISCAILHNMLLTWDGLDIRYEDPLSWHSMQDIVHPCDDEPQTDIFDRVQRRTLVHTDMTTIRSREQLAGTTDDEEISEATFYSQRLALIEHFHYHWCRNEIIWLK